ncbi:Ent-kaurene oxidase, chloroplastic-like protein [Tanacetum coccineum]
MANKKIDDCSTTETTSINNVGVVDVSILKFSGHWQSDYKLARQRPDGIVLVIDFTIVGVQTTTYMSNNVPSVTGNHHIFHQPPNASDFCGRQISTLSSLTFRTDKDRAKPIDTVKKSELKAKFQVATVIAVCANWEFARIEGIGCISVISLRKLYHVFGDAAGWLLAAALQHAIDGLHILWGAIEVGKDVESLDVEDLGINMKKDEMFQVLVDDIMMGAIEIDWRDFFPYLKWVSNKKFENKIHEIYIRRNAVMKALIKEHKNALLQGSYIDYLLSEAQAFTDEQQIMSV